MRKVTAIESDYFITGSTTSNVTANDFGKNKNRGLGKKTIHNFSFFNFIDI